jgi:hypothetical protein
VALGSSERRASWETECSMQQLGAWVTSEEAPKPRRGFRELLKLFSEAWIVKTLKSGPWG